MRIISWVVLVGVALTAIAITAGAEGQPAVLYVAPNGRDANQLIVIGKNNIPVLDREIAPLQSRHTGSGGYVISRETAAALCACTGSTNTASALRL